MRRCAVVLLTIALLSATPAISQTHNVETVEEVKAETPWSQAPDGFRDVKFGATEAEAIAILGPMKCNDVKWESLPPHRSCSTKDRSKAFRVENAVVATYYIFYEAKFVGVTLSETISMSVADYAPPLFAQLSAAFVERYGTPTIRRTFRHHGTREVTIRRTVGGRSAGSRIDFVPFDYKTFAVVWENDDVNAYLTSGEGARLSYGVIETRAWEKLKEEAREAAKKPASVTPF